MSWQLHGPTAIPSFVHGLPDPGQLLQMASLLYVARLLWRAARGRVNVPQGAAHGGTPQ